MMEPKEKQTFFCWKLILSQLCCPRVPKRGLWHFGKKEKPKNKIKLKITYIWTAVIIKITGGVKWINGQQASGTTASLLFDLYIIKSTFVFFLFYPLRWCVFKKRHLFSSVWKRSSRFIPKWTSQRFFSPTDLFPIIILALQYSTQPSHREKHSPFHVKFIIARGFRIIQTVNWEKTIDNWRDKREEDKKKTTIGLGWWWVSKSRLFQVH